MKKVIATVLILFSLLLVTAGCSQRTVQYDYTVEFDSNGGTGVTEIVTGEIKNCPTPQKNGFIFEGWYEKTDFSSKIVQFPYSPTQNITLYAKYIDVEIGNEEIKFSYDAESDSFTASEYNGLSQNVVIPALHEKKPVTKVALGFLKKLTDLRKFYIGKNLQKIDEFFYNCPLFEGYEILTKNEYFSVIDGVLFDKEITELISFPRAKNSETYKIPDRVVKIGRNSFRNADGITEIIFGERTEILEGKFDLCDNLQKISANNQYFYSDNGVLYNAERKVLIACPVDYGESYTVLSSTEQIEEGAFLNCRLKRLVLNADLKSFGVQEKLPSLESVVVKEGSGRYYSQDGVLYDRENEELVLYPSAKKGESFTVEKVKVIGKNAFAYTKNLTEITISAEVTKISQFAFFGSYVRKITFKENSKLAEINNTAFYNTADLKSVELTAITPPDFPADEEVAFTFFVPEESYDLYLDAWRVHYLHIEILEPRK